MSIYRGRYYPADHDSGGPTPGAKALMAYLTGRFPGATNLGIYVNKDVAGTTVLSVHATGRAGDTGTPGDPQWGRDMAELLHTNSNELGVDGIIHDRRAWWSNYGDGWVDYGGSDPHTGHVHWELTPDAATGLTIARCAAILNPATTPTAGRPTLHRGSTGPDVSYLQGRLIAHGLMRGYAPNGVFGPVTDAAVRQFQSAQRIAVDGYVGPITWARLG